MSSPTGFPTNALFGFTRDLLWLRTEKRPEYLLCAFDLPGPTFREALLLRLREVAILLGVSERQVWTLIRAQQLPVVYPPERGELSRGDGENLSGPG